MTETTVTLKYNNDVIDVIAENTKGYLNSFKVTLKHETNTYSGVLRLFGKVTPQSITKVSKIMYLGDSTIIIFLFLDGRQEEIRLRNENLMSSKSIKKFAIYNTEEIDEEEKKKEKVIRQQTENNDSIPSSLEQGDDLSQQKVQEINENNDLDYLLNELNELKIQINKLNNSIIKNTSSLVEIKESQIKDKTSTEEIQTKQNNKINELEQEILLKCDELYFNEKLDSINVKIKDLTNSIYQTIQNNSHELSSFQENKLEEIQVINNNKIEQQNKNYEDLSHQLSEIQQHISSLEYEFDDIQEILKKQINSSQLINELIKTDKKIEEEKQEEKEINLTKQNEKKKEGCSQNNQFIFILSNLENLIEKLNNDISSFNCIDFWEGVKREIIPNYIILVDDQLIKLNRDTIRSLYPSIPIICATSNQEEEDLSILKYTSLNSLCSSLIEKVTSL
ncbi:spindle assembly checkpoint component MAD1, putative [Entamoeba dispar SAW760]|uniref:Spindle assembly checkpoint component MAD1, putative n=1 Tax=Entamoeba dispar (strain ATCC PRA-260 / SAW760) TaxID=370354 RepID=B0EHY1_ENTDS|nr:spindle assembly checkpoint component MAD1, putative [Entamoeba dispar SAW760]EDR25925.1 spindle assembly checkpoint component MAD1, putative [Entamoeba dispar SAW760]|eukprot:EDR25925.1 spindle assembly checkpoint component MAD1, putative [Entamoeba dispar SAW760]